MAIDLPTIKIVRTTPPNIGGEVAAVEQRLIVKPVASVVCDSCVQAQIVYLQIG
jgi:hypothetical protein